MSFVSRGGEKLSHALRELQVDVQGKVCADLGCSTGGFTDCLLQAGAAKVYAVDTGYGVLAWTLRNNPKVVVMERQNALHVQLPEKVDVVVVDAGWTTQEKIVPVALELLQSEGVIVSLLKPHYEAPKSLLRAGHLTDEQAKDVADAVVARLREMGVQVAGMTPSPIRGEKGKNQEYLLLIKP